MTVGRSLGSGRPFALAQALASTPLPRIGKGFLELGTGELREQGGWERRYEKIIHVRSDSEDT